MTRKRETVAAIYDAFKRGDIPFILERLAPDVQWDAWADGFAQRADVPWLRTRTGRAGVAEFFRLVGEFKIDDFQTLEMMEGPNAVAAEIVIHAHVPGGGSYRDDEIHVWTFDDAGLVVRFRHYVDTAKHIAAAKGLATAG